MKIRSGFVSNSSSSSFLLITTKETLDSVSKELSDLEKIFLLKNLFVFGKVELDGKKYLVSNEEWSSESLCETYFDIFGDDDDDYEKAGELVEKFTDKFKGKKDSYFVRKGY